MSNCTSLAQPPLLGAHKTNFVNFNKAEKCGQGLKPTGGGITLIVLTFKWAVMLITCFHQPNPNCFQQPHSNRFQHAIPSVFYQFHNLQP